MGKIKEADLKVIKQQNSLRLDKEIRAGNWDIVATMLNRICNTIPIIDEVVGSEFVSAVLKEATDEYGVDELVSGGNLYMEDFQRLEEIEKEVTTGCGSKIKVKGVKCMTPYDSQVMEFYYDYLELNDKKVLSVTITDEELTTRACGLETYNKLRDLILGKAQQAATRYIRDKIFCILNDSRSYAKIVEIPYTCDDCDGENKLAAITKFSSRLQLEAQKYNIAGRDYEVPRKSQMWLVKSTELEASLANIMSGKFNSSAIDVDSKFARVFEEPKYTLSDGVILDRQWLQVKQVKQKVYWEFNGKYLAECGNYHYWFKSGAVKFLLGAPFRLVKVDKEEMEMAKKIAGEIKAMTDQFEVTDEADAKSQIQAKIDELNSGTPKMTLTYTFSNFTAPTDDNLGSIWVSVEIKNAKNIVLEIGNNKFDLKKK